MTAASSESPDVTITALADGPLEVAGEVRILASDGTLVKETAKSYLCRCGHSEKKPFCDGAHKREGFTAP
jgi:CDGSH-type Zn-finger protein